MELSNQNLVYDDNPLIRTLSQNVSLPLCEEDRELLLAMHRYVLESQDDELCAQKNLSPAVGLAAIQVGVPKKMIAVTVPDEETGELRSWALANPKLISRSKQMAFLENGEGCLSVKDIHDGVVVRPYHIKVKGYDALTNKDVIIDAKGFLAMVLQHELAHLNGGLFYDHIVSREDVDPTAIVLE